MPKEQKATINTSDLRGSVQNPLIPADSHFGLSKSVWDDAQKIANLLPINIPVFGDVEEETVLHLIEQTKAAEIQVKHWTEVDSTTKKYLNLLNRAREKQANVARNVAQTNLTLAELEAELGAELADIESKRRQVVANYRKDIQSTQDDLVISLNRIAEQYLKDRDRKEQAIAAQGQKEKEQTPFIKQTASLADKFRQKREARCNLPPVNITARLKQAST